MAGTKVSDYSISDANGEALILSVDKQRRGYIQLTLTEMDSTDEPSIAAGSIVDVNGTLYEFTSDESITGSPSDGTVYIKLVPDGDDVTAEYDNDAPVWDDSKQGWYESGTSNRYVARLIKNSTAYYEKVTMLALSAYILSAYIEKLEIGELNMYWGGAITAYTLSDTVTNGFNYKFHLKKPAIISYTWVVPPSGSITSDIYIFTNAGLTTTSTLSSSLFAANTNEYILPCKFKIQSDTVGTYSAVLTMTIYSVEGITDVNAGNIDSVIEIL